MIGEWCTIESDPWTFTELSHRLGLEGVQFKEVLDLDSSKEMIEEFGDVYGFIFLFKWDYEDQKKRLVQENPAAAEDLLFIKQIVTNACATIAIFNMAFNLQAENTTVSLSNSLTEFKTFITDLPSEMRGLALTNSEEIRTAHNSFIELGSLNADEKEKSSKGEAFHYVALMPVGNKLVEFDGMRDSPTIHCDLPDDDVVGGTMNWIQSRISSVEGGELRFSLLAMVPDQIERLTKLIESCDDENVKGILAERLENEREKRKPPVRKPIEEQDFDRSHHLSGKDLPDGDKAKLQEALNLIQSMKNRNVFG